MPETMMKPLDQQYWEWVKDILDAEGMKIPYGIILGGDDTLTMVALAMDQPWQCYDAFLKVCVEKDAKEAIFALDRYTKPGQGTRYGDVLAGHYLKDGKWLPFVIEYQIEPRIVEPIDYTNVFWNNALKLEMADSIKAMLRRR